MFYQSMQCPFSADECDFAHVIINEDTPHPRPNDAPQANHRTKVCRYFASGSCAQGMWCRFKHPTTGELFYSCVEDRPNTMGQPDHPDQEETGDIREGGAVFTEGEVNMKKHRSKLELTLRSYFTERIIRAPFAPHDSRLAVSEPMS